MHLIIIKQNFNFDNAQSEVIRSKYDYIFKLKVLEFYFGIQVLE